MAVRRGSVRTGVSDVRGPHQSWHNMHSRVVVHTSPGTIAQQSSRDGFPGVSTCDLYLEISRAGFGGYQETDLRNARPACPPCRSVIAGRALYKHDTNVVSVLCTIYFISRHM